MKKLYFILWILSCTAASLATTESSLTLTCLFETKSDTTLEYISGDQYACDLQSDIPYIDVVTLTLNNTHEGTITNSEVTALLINNRQIFQVPKLKSIFAGLKYLKITKTPLKYLRKENIAEYNSILEHLIIQESAIEVIESDLFSGFTKIITIDLKKNQIFYIADDVFTGLDALKNIILEGNLCKNSADPPEDIKNCIATEATACTSFIDRIALSTCKPAAISIDKFLTHQKTISELELDAYNDSQDFKKLISDFDIIKAENSNLTRDYNSAKVEITKIQSEIDILIPKLAQLESEAEKCMEVEGTCRFTVDNSYGYSCIAHNISVNSSEQEISWTGTHQAGLSNESIVGLIIRDLVVNYIPKNIGTTFSNLKNLIIQNCGLKKLSKNDFVSLNKLEIIHIVSNEIASIEAGTFSDLESLNTLDLPGNKIKNLPSNIFVQLKALTSLNLNNNELTALKSNFLPSTNLIQSFSAKNNKLTLIQNAFVWRLRSAKLIDFSGNNCDLKYDTEASDSYISFYNLILKKC